MILRALLKTLALPPAINFVLLFAAFACWWRYPKFALILGGFSLLMLWALATPMVSYALLSQLESAHRAATVEQLRFEAGEAIVVLGGGRYHRAPEYLGRDLVNAFTLVRLRYGAHLHRHLGVPVLVTGGRVFGHERRSEAQLMAASLESNFNIAANWLETESRTTRENAIFSARILLNAGIKRILLVTDASHMRRAVIEFERQGLSVVSAPTGFADKSWANLSILNFLPQSRALFNSQRALHEWLGILVYQLTAT